MSQDRISPGELRRVIQHLRTSSSILGTLRGNREMTRDEAALTAQAVRYLAKADVHLANALSILERKEEA